MASSFDHLPSEHRDDLTNIPNRHVAKKWLSEAYCRSAGRFALLLLDIRGFKLVNDTYGHPEGDEVLRTTADVLESILRATDFFPARWGGDEFLIILNDIDSEESVKIVQERIRQTLDDYGIEIAIAGRVHDPRETILELIIAVDALTYADRNRQMAEKYNSPELRHAAHELDRITSEYDIPPRDVPTLIELARKGIL